MIGPEAPCRIGAADDRFVWQGEQHGLRHEVCLWLHPDSDVWFWRVDVVNQRDGNCHAMRVIQDLGLGERGFLMGNEAYASQYLDHFVARHPRMNHVLMSRQNLSQRGAHPWTAHGCLEGAAGFATDFRELMGAAHRDADQFAPSFRRELPSNASSMRRPAPLFSRSRDAGAWRERRPGPFLASTIPIIPRRRPTPILPEIDAVERATRRGRGAKSPCPARRGASARCAGRRRRPPGQAGDQERYRRRVHVERANGPDLSFFTPAKSANRHVVLRDKERLVARRHGALLRSGDGMLPDEDLLCATCWMHGVFGAQLTIGNTSFHKLFSVSRDPYNVTRGTVCACWWIWRADGGS